SSVALVCMAGFVVADEKWEKISSKIGKCEIEFPNKPKEMVAGDQTQIILEAEMGKAAYMLQFNKMPSEIDLTNADLIKKVFDGGQGGLTMALNGKIVKSEDGKFGKFPSRDIDMEVKDLGVYRVKFILTKDQFYQVTVLGQKDFVNGKDVER